MIFLALVTFEHDGDDGDHLPLGCQGASGWMAIDANEADEAIEGIGASLASVSLKLVSAERVHVVEGPNDVESLDDHLADNIRDWEPGRRTVWGTIHLYAGDRRG